jgi:hypothetical protein
MHSLLTGLLAGALSGALMGLFSHILFRVGLFHSSLIIIDGSFFFRVLKRQPSSAIISGAGLGIHLLTSALFGGFYMAGAAFLGLDPVVVRSFIPISIYTGFLWLSMLFMALPIAGQGVLGRKSSPYSWLEQLILHGIFAVTYYLSLGLFS